MFFSKIRIINLQQRYLFEKTTSRESFLFEQNHELINILGIQTQKWNRRIKQKQIQLKYTILVYVQSWNNGLLFEATFFELLSIICCSSLWVLQKT